MDGTYLNYYVLVFFECSGPVVPTIQTVSVSGGKLGCTLTDAPRGALLVAARYDAKGKLLGMTTKDAPFGKTAGASDIAVGAGASYRLMLLDPRSLVPLCAAWRG